MSCSPIGRSSSQEQDSQIVDERKRKRMQSNRESAKRSRMKKQLLLDNLMGEITRFKTENTEFKAAINLTTQQYMMVEKENNILQAKHAELARRLQNANSILRIYEEFTGLPLDILDMPEPVSLMKPWSLSGMVPPEPSYPLIVDPLLKPCQVTTIQPIMAASNLAPF
ncbi:hypothetical protein LUZ60_013278 [Juncus effusus]|nr:hypothetical protein LUZ60_013278 [Juncus effusus]